MQTVLKQFCYPVNFLACACSRKNVHAMIRQTEIGACSKRVICKKSWRRESALSPLVFLLAISKAVLLFVDHLCFLCLVFLKLLRMFIAALWSPAGKGLTSWLLLVTFIVIF